MKVFLCLLAALCASVIVDAQPNGGTVSTQYDAPLRTGQPITLSPVAGSAELRGSVTDGIVGCETVRHAFTVTAPAVNPVGTRGEGCRTSTCTNSPIVLSVAIGKAQASFSSFAPGPENFPDLNVQIVKDSGASFVGQSFSAAQGAQSFTENRNANPPQATFSSGNTVATCGAILPSQCVVDLWCTLFSTGSYFAYVSNSGPYSGVNAVGNIPNLYNITVSQWNFNVQTIPASRTINQAALNSSAVGSVPAPGNFLTQYFHNLVTTPGDRAAHSKLRITFSATPNSLGVITPFSTPQTINVCFSFFQLPGVGPAQTPDNSCPGQSCGTITLNANSTVATFVFSTASTSCSLWTDYTISTHCLWFGITGTALTGTNFNVTIDFVPNKSPPVTTVLASSLVDRSDKIGKTYRNESALVDINSNQCVFNPTSDTVSPLFTCERSYQVSLQSEGLSASSYDGVLGPNLLVRVRAVTDGNLYYSVTDNTLNGPRTSCYSNPSQAGLLGAGTQPAPNTPSFWSSGLTDISITPPPQEVLGVGTPYAPSIPALTQDDAGTVLAGQPSQEVEISPQRSNSGKIVIPACRWRTTYQNYGCPSGQICTCAAGTSYDNNWVITVVAGNQFTQGSNSVSNLIRYAIDVDTVSWPVTAVVVDNNTPPIFGNVGELNYQHYYVDITTSNLFDDSYFEANLYSNHEQDELWFYWNFGSYAGDVNDCYKNSGRCQTRGDSGLGIAGQSPNPGTDFFEGSCCRFLFLPCTAAADWIGPNNGYNGPGSATLSGYRNGGNPTNNILESGRKLSTLQVGRYYFAVQGVSQTLTSGYNTAPSRDSTGDINTQLYNFDRSIDYTLVFNLRRTEVIYDQVPVVHHVFFQDLTHQYQIQVPNLPNVLATVINIDDVRNGAVTLFVQCGSYAGACQSSTTFNCYSNLASTDIGNANSFAGHKGSLVVPRCKCSNNLVYASVWGRVQNGTTNYYQSNLPIKFILTAVIVNTPNTVQQIAASRAGETVKYFSPGSKANSDPTNSALAGYYFYQLSFTNVDLTGNDALVLELVVEEDGTAPDDNVILYVSKNQLAGAVSASGYFCNPQLSCTAAPSLDQNNPLALQQHCSIVIQPCAAGVNPNCPATGVAPFDGIHNTWYVSVFHQQNFGAAEDVHFTVSAQVVAQQAQTLTNGVWLKGDLLNGQYRHYKFSLAGTTIKPTDKLLTELYNCPDSRVQATLYFTYTNSTTVPSLAGLASDCLNSICGTCTVGGPATNPNYCHIQVNPCTLSTQTGVYYMSVLTTQPQFGDYHCAYSIRTSIISSEELITSTPASLAGYGYPLTGNLYGGLSGATANYYTVTLPTPLTGANSAGKTLEIEVENVRGGKVFVSISSNRNPAQLCDGANTGREVDDPFLTAAGVTPGGPTANLNAVANQLHWTRFTCNLAAGQVYYIVVDAIQTLRLWDPVSYNIRAILNDVGFTALNFGTPATNTTNNVLVAKQYDNCPIPTLAAPPASPCTTGNTAIYGTPQGSIDSVTSQLYYAYSIPASTVGNADGTSLDIFVSQTNPTGGVLYDVFVSANFPGSNAATNDGVTTDGTLAVPTCPSLCTFSSIDFNTGKAFCHIRPCDLLSSGTYYITLYGRGLAPGATISGLVIRSYVVNSKSILAVPSGSVKLSSTTTSVCAVNTADCVITPNVGIFQNTNDQLESYIQGSQATGNPPAVSVTNAYYQTNSTLGLNAGEAVDFIYQGTATSFSVRYGGEIGGGSCVPTCSVNTGSPLICRIYNCGPGALSPSTWFVQLVGPSTGVAGANFIIHKYSSPAGTTNAISVAQGLPTDPAYNGTQYPFTSNSGPYDWIWYSVSLNKPTADQDLAYDLVFNPSTNLFAGLGGNGGIFALPAGVTTPVVLPDLQTRTFPSGNQVAINGDSSVRGSFGCGAIGFAAPAGKCCFQNVNYFFAFVNPNTFNSTAASTPFGIEWLVQDRGSVASTLALNTVNSALTISDTPNLSDGRTRIHWQSFTLPPQTSFWINALVNPVSGSTNANVFDMTLYMGTDYKSGSGTTLGTCGNFTYTSASNSDFTGGLRTNATATYPNGIVVGSTFGNPGACRYNAGSDPTNTASAQGPLAGATSLTPGGTNYTAFYPFCGCLNNQKSITIYIGITYRGTTTDPVVTLTYSLNVFLFPLATPAINTAVTNVVYPNSNTAVRSISGAVVYHHYAVAINPTTLSLINPTGVLANFIPDAPIITAGPITIDTNRMYAELGINNVRITQSPSTVISYPFTNYYSLSGQLAGSTGDNTCYSNSQWDPTLCNGWVSGSLNTTSGSANVTSSFCRISLASLLNACGQTWYFSVASTTGLLANQTYSYDFSFNLFANTQNEVVITTLTPVAAVQPNTIPPASEAPYTTFTSQNKTIAAGASQNIYTFFKFSTSTFSNGKPFDTTAPVQWARVSVLNQGTATSPSRILNTIRVLAGYTTTPTGLPIVVPTFGSANTGNICTNLPNTDNNVTSLVENLCVIEFDPSQFRMLSGDGGPHTLYVEVQANTPNTVIPDSYAFQIKVEILTATFLDSPINLTPVVAPAWSYDKLKEIYDNQYQFYQFNIPENSCYFYDFTVKFSQEGCGTKNLKLYWSWQDVYATTASQVVKFDTTRPLVVPSPAYSVQGTGVPGIFGTVGPSFVTHSNLDSCTIIGGSYQVAVYAPPGTALFQSPINVTTGVFANRKTTYRVQARLQQWAVRKIALECFDSQVLHYTTDINGTALDNLKKFVPRYEVAVDAVNRGTQLWFDLQLSTPVLAGANVRLQVSQNPTPQQQGDDSSSSTSYCGWGTNTAGISGDYANQEFDYACNIVAGGTTCSITIAPCEFRSTTWYAYVSIGALTAGIITEPNLCIGFLNSGVVSSVPTACNSTLADNTVVSVRARYDRKSIPVAQLDQTPYQVVWVGNLVPAYWQYYKVNVNSNDALGLFDAKLAVTPCAGSPCNLRMYVSRGPVGFATRNYGAASANAGFPYDAATPGYASTLSPVCPLTTPDQSSSCTCFGGYGNPNRIPMKIVGGAAIDYDILPKGAWNLNSGMATSQTTNDLTCGPVTSSATFCRIQDQFCFSVQNQYFIGVVNDIAQPPGATNTQCPYTLTVNTRVSASSLFSNVPISGAVGCADYYQIQNRPGVDTFNWPEVVQITVSLTNTGNAVGSSQDLRLMWKEGRIPHSYNWDQLPTVGGTVTSVVPAPNSLSASAPAGCADCAGSTDITIAGLFTGAGAAVYGYDIAKGSSANLYINCPVAAPYVAVQRVCNPNNTEEYNQNNAVSFAGCCNELAPSAMCSRNVNYGLRITVYQLPSNQSVTVPTTNSNTSFPIPGSVGKFVASGAAGTFYVIDYSKSTSGVATYFKGRVPVAPCCQSTCNLASVPSKQVVIPDANPAGATYYFLATGPSFNVYTVTPTALAVSDNTKLIQAETVTTLTAGSFVHYVVNPAAGRTSFTLQFTTFEGRCGSRSLSLYPSQIAPPFDSTCFGSVPQTISFGNCGTASSAAFGCSDAPWYFSVSSASPCDVSYHINVVFAGAIRTSVGTDHNAAFTPVTILKSCGATAPSQSFFVTVTNTSRILSPTIRNIRGGNPVSSANKLAFTVTVQQPGCVAAGSASADDDAPVIADNGVDSNKLSANASPLFGTSNFLAAAQTQNILSCVDPGTYRIDVTNNGNLLADDDWYGYEIQFVNTWVLSGTVSGQQLTGAHRQFYQVAGTAGKSISITVTVHSGPALRLYVHSGCDAGVRGSEAYLQRKICQCGTCKVEISTLAAHSGSNNYYIVLEGANIEGTYASNSYLVRSQNTNYEKATVYDIATTLGSSNCVSVPTTGFCGASNGEFTGSAFAGSLNSNVWKYNSNLADNEAQCRYQTLLVRCPSPTAACRQWLRIFSCLESFPQCDSNGFQLPLCGSVCNKVQAACGAFLQYSGATQGFINAGAQYICSSSRYFVDGSCNTTTNACTGIQSSCPTATPTPIPVPPPPPPSASPSTPIPPWATVTIQLPSEDLSINLAPIEVYVPAQTIELVGSAVSTLPTIALMLLALVFALLL